MKRALGIRLVAVALALVAVAYTVARKRDKSSEQLQGSALLPELTTRSEEIQSIEILQGEKTVRLSRQSDGSWTLDSYDNYPARTELVRALIVSASALKVDERMTAKKDRHGELGLAWPDLSGKARFVRFLTTKSPEAAVSEVVFGEERMSPDSIFCRLANQDQTWRARGRVQLPADAIAWTDRVLLALPSKETTAVRFAGLTLTAPPETEPSSEGAPRLPWTQSVAESDRAQWTDAQIQSALTGLPSFLERLEFDAVRRAHENSAATPEWSPTFETKWSTVAMQGHAEDDGVWISFAVLAKPGAPAPASNTHEGDPFVPVWDAFAKSVSGWEFRLPEWKAETLKRTRSTTTETTAPSGGTPLGIHGLDAAHRESVVPAPPGVLAK